MYSAAVEDATCDDSPDEVLLPLPEGYHPTILITSDLILHVKAFLQFFDQDEPPMIPIHPM